ncbi:5973_t:CDS:2, partial [Ambispora gerdemannii]
HLRQNTYEKSNNISLYLDGSISDYVEIDNDETKYYSSGHDFNDISIIRKVTTTNIITTRGSSSDIVISSGLVNAMGSSRTMELARHMSRMVDENDKEYELKIEDNTNTRKGKDRVIKESYYQPRSEEEKKQIIERNRKRREQESSQATKEKIKETEGIDLNQIAKEIDKQQEQNKKEQKSEQETNQQISLQSKDNDQNIYYGVGLISLVLLVISMAVVRMKRKR